MIPSKYLDDKTVYYLQPSGKFVIGGPQVSVGVNFDLIVGRTWFDASS